MADESTTIIEGSVKLREGKKWKSRWCVMRRLSPVADCIQIQIYRDAGAKTVCKASLSLVQFVGAESGFTLDQQCNTLALLCRDLVAVLAFDSRETLMQWQVKVERQLGASRVHSATWGTTRGRLVVSAAHCTLVEGAPPKVLVVWELAHLRRYGVQEGRFCLEAGAGSGEWAGLHVFTTSRPSLLRRDVDAAIGGALDAQQREETPRGARWPSVESTAQEQWAPATMTVGRCRGCLPRSVSAPGARFTPAWSMPSAMTESMQSYDNYDVPRITTHEMVGEYYDTPRKLTQANDGGGSRSSTLKKSCSCRFESNRLDTLPIVNRERVDSVKKCACERVTDWANYIMCHKNRAREKETTDRKVLYATVDFSQKTRRRILFEQHDGAAARCVHPNYENLEMIEQMAQNNMVDPYVEMSPSGAEYEAMSRWASIPVLGAVRRGGRARSSSAESRSARASSGSNDSGVCEAPLRLGLPDTSSGASDLSDNVETLSLCSSQSSGETHDKRCRLATSTLRPRSGREYCPAPRPPRHPDPALRAT